MCVCTQLTCEFHAEARVGHQESSSTALCLILLKQGVSLNSKLVCSARLAGQQGICLSPTPKSWGYKTRTAMSGFVHGVRDLVSDLHACRSMSSYHEPVS